MLFVLAQQNVPGETHVDSHSGHRPAQSPLHGTEPQHTVAPAGLGPGQPSSDKTGCAFASADPPPSTPASVSTKVSVGTPLQPARTDKISPCATHFIRRTLPREPPTPHRPPSVRRPSKVSLGRCVRTARGRRQRPPWRCRLPPTPRPAAPRRVRGRASNPPHP